MVKGQTQMKGIRIIAIMLMIALVFAGLLVTMINSNVASANAESEATIEFTTEVQGDTTRYVDQSSVGSSVVVTYKITDNDGINSLLLIPEFDSDVFAITSVEVNEETSLGAATITSGDGTKKILLENTGAKYEALDGENEYFLTVTYELIAAIDGEYEFGLDLTSTGENNKSVAYYIEEGEQKGEQTEVEIGVVKANAITLITIQDATIEIGSNNDYEDADVNGIVYDYFFTYKKQEVGVEKVDVLTLPSEADGFYVEYTYSGDADEADIVIKWYQADREWDDELNEYVIIPGTELQGAPVAAGNYVIGISAPATSLYYAVEEQYAYVHINTLLVEVTIADKESDFGENLVALTYTANRAPFEGDSFTIVLSTTATSNSPVATYPITGEATDVVGSYEFNFTDGVYTINGKAITLTALNQTAPYTGSEPEVSQIEYTITDTNSGEAYALDAAVIITKEEGVNVGTYTLTPSFAVAPNGYIVTYVDGEFVITSVGADVNAVKAYFLGLTKTYNGEEQDLLQVTDLPSYYSYTANNNLQTNANDYVITVTVTADGNHNIDGEQSCLFVLDGAINPADVTLTAVNANVYYGQLPVIPEFSVTGTTEEIDYTYEIKDGNSVAITPSAETAVGVYDIVLTNGNNPNFNVTLVDGTYTVSKASATVSAAANNVYYNRDLSTTTSASVNTLALTPVVTYYIDSACTQETTPVNAGTYYVKAVVAETANYNGAEDVASFSILKVKLEGVTFSYENGTASWTAVANDIGKTASETGVEAAALKEGATVTYKVYDGEILITTLSSRSFDAAAATTYKVVATCSDDNYLDSESVMVAAYTVSFDEGEHLGNPDGEVSNMPVTQYIFAGATAIEPATDPSVPSCEFLGWKLGDNDYSFTEAVTGNIILVADWDAITYTVTLKYLPASATEGTDMFTISGLYLNSTVSYAGLGVAPVKSSDNAGIYYTFADKWTDENSVEYAAENDGIAGFTVQSDMTFVAVFNTNYNAFEITYYLADGVSTDVADYVQVGEKQLVTYGDTIEYRALAASQIAWFRTYGWYSNTERTAALLTTMPAENISVYAGYVFDIGIGDVNADGLVNANDITIYRQWIVGGYDVISVQSGDEWATATGEEFDVENHYFLIRVADDNADLSRDIRDVSITRMAIVGGYSWDIVSDSGVTGKAVARTAPTFDLNALNHGISTFSRARLYSDITATEDLIVETNKNVFIDLDGHTLTVKSLSLTTSGKDATITVMNGTIIAEDGITLVAPNGNVVINDVIAYVDGAPVNLQAANSSLHFAGTVEFYNAEIIEGEINEFAEEAPAPAVIHIEEGTHVVVEAQAEIVIEKIIVTENSFEVPEEPSANATITLDNKTETEIEVQGNTLNEISDLAGLIAAAKAGGTYVVTGDIAYNGCVNFQADATIDLNGHTIRSANSIALGVSGGATLTINGNGNVIAQEACVMAFGDSAVVINGGTYTSYDNFVVGTNGTVKTGNDMGHNTITINGGTFNGGIQSAGYVACGIYVANSDTVVVNGGTFNVTNGCGILARSGNTTVGADVVFNVTGDGTTGKVGDSQVTVPAGAVLVYDLAANYPGGDPVLVNGTDYDVAAVVGSVDDINAVKGFAKEIVLGANITTDYNAPIYFTEDMVLNLNGKTIASTNDVALRALNGAKLTINGNGNVNAQEGCVMAFSGSEIVINGGTFTCYDNFVIGTNGTAGYGANKITVNGGVFNGGIQSAGYVACGIYVANSDTMVVNGGTFNVTNGCGILARSGNTTVNAGATFNVTGDGTTGKVGDSKVTVPAGAVLVYDLAANYPGGDPVLVNGTDYDVAAVVGSVDDINAVKGFAKEIVLGANITTDYDAPIYFTEDMVLNLNGKTIASTNDVALRALNGAKLTINGNGNVNAQEGCVMAFSGSEIVINGGTFTCYDNFVIGTNGTAGYGANKITVNGGVFNGGIQSAGYVACGIYVANSDTVVVNGGTFNVTDGCGILARSGNTTVNAGGTFNVTGDGHLGKVGDSKVVVPTGAVLVLDLKANYPGGAPVLTNNASYEVYTIEA